MAIQLTAKAFMAAMQRHRSAAQARKIQTYFKSDSNKEDKFIGIRMGALFQLARQYKAMPVKEIEKLLESDIHEARSGATSIMDKESRDKKTTPERLKSLFDLYMRRHDRINAWDLVDLGCLHMVGNYLLDKPRKILYKMAKSKDIWERRTSIVGTCHFIRMGEVKDTFRIATLLLKDKEDLVHKGAGWMLRFAGDKDRKQLIAFLDQYATTMPRTMLRYAIEKLDPKLKARYMAR